MMKLMIQNLELNFFSQPKKVAKLQALFTIFSAEKIKNQHAAI